MTWHYQLCMKRYPPVASDGEDYEEYAIKEAYCDEEGMVFSLTEKPIEIRGDSTEDILWVLKQIQRDIGKYDILDEDTYEFAPSPGDEKEK